MARGPYQGTYQPNFRPTVVTAPDAIVYINGEADIIGCPSCKKKFDFSQWITQIQVDLSVDSVPGSANITMTVPRHAIEDFYFDGVPMISPMMEIEIFAKGYYLINGLPQYYPIFWGLTTEVTDNYSSGEHTVTINCADILKWWEICRMNVNPAFTAPSGQAGRNICGNVFFGTNPYDTIMTLAQMSFGDIIVGTGSLVTLRKENTQTKTFNAVMTDIMGYWQSRFSRIRSSLLLYGANGVGVRGDSLASAYEKGKRTKGKPLVASTAIRVANGGDDATQFIFDPTDPGVTAFRTQLTQAGQVNFWQAEYQTKLEIANTCKEALGFEFFMDVTGDIVFKPPFYNLDIFANKPVSWVQDIDIIDWNFSESEAEVVTQMTIQGGFGGNIDYGVGEECTPTTSVTDYHLLRKYGWRPQSYNSEWMSDPQIMFYHGMDILDRLNSRRHSGSITVPLRPELRLGFPVYVAPKDQIWYLKGISHNISFGGRATTTLSLTARRSKFIAPKGIGALKMTGDDRASKINKTIETLVKEFASDPKGVKGTSPAKPEPKKADAKKDTKPTVKQLARKTFTLELGGAATTPPIDYEEGVLKSTEPYEPLVLRHPKTGKIVGYPNVVMVYTRPIDSKLMEKIHSGATGQKKGSNPATKKKNAAKTDAAREKASKEEEERLVDANVQKWSTKHSENRYQYGLTSAGVYIYAHDTSEAITQFALVPGKNITTTGEGSEKSDLPKSTAMIRPVSDERGFEVIGHFRYGRGVALRDGSLILDESGKSNSRLKGGEGIDFQTALTGDLFAMLNAQSQGLTAVTSAYANPADALARMLPDDLQTAATISPGKPDEPSFKATEEKFVDTKPLNSPDALGVDASVEAGQLSRALTLTEMGVKGEQYPDDDMCDCQTGRADLAFINVGYQFKNINPSSPVPDNLFGNDAATQGGGVIRGGTAPDLKVPVPATKFAQIKSTVDSFLFDLYSALDGPHQDLENKLRGNPSGTEADSSTRPLPDLFTSGAVLNQEYGAFAPPFGSSNRSGLGDPIATANQFNSAANDLKKSFADFGNNLKNNTQKAQLGQEITNLKGLIARLNKRLGDVQRQNTGGNVTVGNTDNAEDLQRQIAEAQRDLANKQAQLNQLGGG